MADPREKPRAEPDRVGHAGRGSSSSFTGVWIKGRPGEFGLRGRPACGGGGQGESAGCSSFIRANAHALARYAAACQEAGIVPIVEPEVMMDGDHSIEKDAEVTSAVRAAVLAELADFGVDFAGIVLKPNVVIEGADHAERSSPKQVAEATADGLRALVVRQNPSLSV